MADDPYRNNDSIYTDGGGGANNTGMGVVFCCAQPAGGPDAPNFEWSSLEHTQRVSCRRVVYRIRARIGTTAFGERVQYVNDTNTVLMLSIVGEKRCIFVVGCMRRDVMIDQHPVATEMDKLLVQLQRSYQQHIAGAISVSASGRIEDQMTAARNNNTNTNTTNVAANGGGAAAAASNGIDREAVVAFNAAVQQLIDATSQRISEIIAVRSIVRSSHFSARSVLSTLGGFYNRAGSQHQHNYNNYNNNQRGTSLGNNNHNNNTNSSTSFTAEQQNNRNTLSSQQANGGNAGRLVAPVAAYYALGGAGAVEEPFLDDANADEDMIIGGAGIYDDDKNCCCCCCCCCCPESSSAGADGVVGGPGSACGAMAASCCSTRVRFILCFLLLFIGATVVFVLMFACRKHDTNEFKLSC